MMIRIAMGLFTVGLAVLGLMEMLLDRWENRG